MIRTVIAEDEPPARDKLARWLREAGDFDVIAAVGDGLEAAEAIQASQPHVAFLDIRMPGLGGLEVAAQLESQSAPLLVFVTAFDEYAVQAFDLEAVDYLLKPYDRERFQRALERVRLRLQGSEASTRAVQLARERSRSRDRLLVPQGERLVLIETAHIEALEADDNYVHVHTTEREHLVRRTLHDLLLQLGEERFVRIHKSAAVSVAAIATLTPLFKGDYEVVLRSGRCLRMSRRYKDAVFATLGKS